MNTDGPDGTLQDFEIAYSTPNIDALARREMLFTNAHTPGAACLPARTAMLTGLTPYVARSLVVWLYGSITPMPKVTFSVDHDTVRTLRRAAERARKPQSLIVREAIAQYAARDERLSDEERTRLLGVLRQMKTRPPTRSDIDVDRELQAIRRARRVGWHRSVR